MLFTSRLTFVPALSVLRCAITFTVEAACTTVNPLSPTGGAALYFACSSAGGGAVGEVNASWLETELARRSATLEERTAYRCMLSEGLQLRFALYKGLAVASVEVFESYKGLCVSVGLSTAQRDAIPRPSSPSMRRPDTNAPTRKCRALERSAFQASQFTHQV